jgi:hypothetical protein
MCHFSKLIFLTLVFASVLGCGKGTNWEPIADTVCKKYEERVAILKSVQSKDDAKSVNSSHSRWQSEYDKLVDQFQIDSMVNAERERSGQMHGVGADYDPDLGNMTRTSFTNPFR